MWYMIHDEVIMIFWKDFEMKMLWIFNRDYIKSLVTIIAFACDNIMIFIQFDNIELEKTSDNIYFIYNFEFLNDIIYHINYENR